MGRCSVKQPEDFLLKISKLVIRQMKLFKVLDAGGEVMLHRLNQT